MFPSFPWNITSYLFPQSCCEASDADVRSNENVHTNYVSSIKTPIQYDTIKNVLQQGTVNVYDGFRLIVQKQVNLNTVVSHFYWIGSQATGQSIYQYRIILPFEEKLLNIASDLDFNIEGEVKLPLSEKISSKSNFVIGEQATNISIDLEHQDNDSTTQISFSKSAENLLTISRMQALTPTLSFGGSGMYNLGSNHFARSFGFVYDDRSILIGSQWDTMWKVLFLKRINPNRLHLASELTIDQNNNSQMSLSAEYMLKQSKLQFSVDSNLLLKSTVESSVAPGTTLQFNAEVSQLKEHYRFGYGLVIG